MACFSFQRITLMIPMVALSFFCSISLADIRVADVRVIVEYDSTGHRILRVVDLPASRSAPISDHLNGKIKPDITPKDTISKVKLLWFSADGVLIKTALIDDPRLTHTPLSGTDQRPSMIGLEAGAFVVSGPPESATLEVHLPANITLGLGQQFWRMDLY